MPDFIGYPRPDGYLSSWYVDGNPTETALNVPSSAWVGFNLLDGDLTDISGNEADLVSNGTGTPFADAEWYEPNGTDNFLEIAAPTLIPTLLDLSTLEGEQIVIKAVIELQALGVSQNIISLGRSSTSSVGFFGLQLTSSNQIQLQLRGVGAPGIDGNQFTAFNLGNADQFDADLLNTPLSMVISLAGLGDNKALCFADINGRNYSNIWDIDLAARGSPTNATDTAQRFMIGARANNASSEDLYSVLKVSGIKIIRRSLINYLDIGRYSLASARNLHTEPRAISAL